MTDTKTRAEALLRRLREEDWNHTMGLPSLHHMTRTECAIAIIEAELELAYKEGYIYGTRRNG